MLEVRAMSTSKLDKIRDIDRTEEIRVGYRQEGAELIEMSVDWDTPGWFEGDGEHSFSEIIRGAERCLSSGGTAIGAFDGERLVGIAIYRPRLTDSMGQLALLHVSDGYRRLGVASRLLAEVLPPAGSCLPPARRGPFARTPRRRNDPLRLRDADRVRRRFLPSGGIRADT